MYKYGFITLVLGFVLILTFPAMGGSYYNYGFPYFSGPMGYGGVPFYTDASPATLSTAIDTNLSSTSFVSISQSPTGGYDLMPGSTPLTQPIEVCMCGDLSSVIGSYMDTFGSVIVGKETSGENSYYYIYPGSPQASSSIIPGSIPTFGLYGMPEIPTIPPTIPVAGISSLVPILSQLGIPSSQSQGLVLPNVLIPPLFDYMTQLERIFLSLNPTFPVPEGSKGERSAHINLPGSFITPGFNPIYTPYPGMNSPFFPGPFLPPVAPIFGSGFPGFGLW